MACYIVAQRLLFRVKEAKRVGAQEWQLSESQAECGALVEDRLSCYSVGSY